MEKSKCSMALQILAMSSSDLDRVKAVDKVIEYIQSTELEYEVAAFETTIMGDLDELMSVLEKSIEIASSVDPSIFANVKINYNALGSVMSIEDKVAKYR